MTNPANRLIDLPYRPCAGIMLLNAANLAFAGRRIDTVSEAWQMPQGGIGAGEEPRAAALRELHEETGTDKAEVLAESRDWLTYDLPPELTGKVLGGKYRGQRQKWFAMRFLGEDGDINLQTETPEFAEWRWVRPAELPDLIVPFKRDLYHAVLEEFSHLWR